MQKLAACAALLLAGTLLAVSSGGDHPVFLNGKRLGNAVTIRGVVALPLEDLATAAGLRLTTDPGLQLQGSTLSAKFMPGRLKWGPIVLKRGIDASSIDINKEGVISTEVLMFNGKAYVPLRDVARALGGVWSPGNLAPGAAIQLNFTRNPNAILIGL